MNFLQALVLAWRRRHPTSSAMILIGATVIGAAFRLCTLDNRSLWLDELFSLMSASEVNLTSLPPHLWDNGNMILFYVIGHYWMKLVPFGPVIDEFAVRLLPVLFSVATIPVLYLVAERISAVQFPKSRHRSLYPLIVTMWFAFNSLSIRYSQEFRGYSLQLLLLTIATLFLVIGMQGRRRKQRRWWIGYALMSGAAAYAHMIGILFSATQLSSLLAIAILKRDSIITRRVITVLALLGITLIPLIVQIVAAGSGQIAWIEEPTTKTVGATILRLFGISKDLELPVQLSLLAFCAAPAALGLRTMLRVARREDSASIALAIPLIVVPAITLIFSLMVTPIWLTRYLHFLLLPISLAWGIGCIELLDIAQGYLNRIRAIAALSLAPIVIQSVVIAAALWSAPSYLEGEGDWRVLSKIVQSHCGLQATVVLASRFDRSLVQISASGYEIRTDSIVNDIDAVEVPVTKESCLVVWGINRKELETFISSLSASGRVPVLYLVGSLRLYLFPRLSQ